MTIRVGLIGCGVISEHHLEALRGRPDAELVACADIVQAAARRCADKFSIPHALASMEALLDRDDLDLIVICVPPNSHEEMFLAAIQSGRHVLIEKPLGFDMSQADRMVQAEAQSDRIAGVALVHRYMPAYHVLRELVQSGAIGKIRQVRLDWGKNMYQDSRFTQPQSDPRGWLVDPKIAGGGILMSSTIHFISTIHYLLCQPAARRISARLRELHPQSFAGIEDEADLWIELDHGMQLVLRDSWACDAPYRAEVVGEQGQFVLTGDDWINLTIDGTCAGPIPGPYRSFVSGGRFHAEPSQLEAPFRPTFGGLVDDLFESIKLGSRLPRLPSIRHTRNMQAIVHAAYQSQQAGTRQDIDWRS